MRRFVASLAVAAFAATPSAALTLSGSTTPVAKVVELLGLLKHQLQEDADADKLRHANSTAWFHREHDETARVVKETSDKIESLKTLLASGEAFREGKTAELDKTAGEQAAAEKELQTASAQRQKERLAFEESEAKLADAADSFERSLEILAKKAPVAALLDSGAGVSAGGAKAAPGSHAAAFLTVAKRLRTQLEQGKDLELTESQRELLDALVRVAAQRAANAEAKVEDASSAPDFLQVKSKSLGRTGENSLEAGPYGDYASQTVGVSKILQNVLDKTQASLDDARKQESAARDTFEKLKGELEEEIHNKETTVADMKMQISRSQEEAGQRQSQLLAAQQLLKVTEEQLSQLDADFEVKNKAYSARKSKRDDEALAVDNAKRILQSDAAKAALSEEDAGSAPAPAPAFFQLGKSAKPRQRSSVDVLRVALSAKPLSLLTVKMTSHRSRRHSLEDPTDPFAKVKTMVRAMLRKLSEEQAQDHKQASWCDSELAKSTKSKEERETDVQKLKDRIAEMDADLAQLNDDIKNLNKDLKEMDEATAQATKLRTAESAATTAVLAQYKDAQKLLRSAISVLKKVYEQQEEGSDGAAADDSGFKANGMGSGVIGMLEIAEADYKQLEDEVKLSSEAAAKDFNDLMSDAEVREAVFKKDLEYKTRTQVKLQGDLIRAGNDLKSYQKELEAVVNYLDELKTSCTVKGDTYDERKARRETQLASLREALTYLNGDGMA